jgi:Pectate lyase superfamily protein/Right handed beta helix region
MKPLLCFFLTLVLVTVSGAETKSVRDFGSVGDGKTDDSAAIQKAVDSGLGDIVFPKGNYRLSKTVTIELDKTGYTALVGDGTARIVMAGSGPAFHFIGTHAGSADPGAFKPEVWERQRAPMVSHLEIIGDNAEADGIEATGTMQLTVTETAIHDLRNAIHLTTRNRNIIVANCHLYHNSGAGVFYDHVNLHQSNITGSHISYNAAGGVVTRGGEVRNIQISGCDIESNMDPRGPPTANVLLDNTEGSTDEVAIVGCTLQHNSKSPGSANIRVIGKGITSTKDPTETQEGHIAITGNAMSDVWSISIWIMRAA